jgi:hypothetical protein
MRYKVIPPEGCKTKNNNNKKPVKPEALRGFYRFFATPKVESSSYFMDTHERVFFSHISVNIRVSLFLPNDEILIFFNSLFFVVH